MGTKRIPELYTHTCDICGAEETTKHNSRPKYWAELKLIMDAYDYHGAAVADASTIDLMCPDCIGLFAKALNELRTSRAKQA